MEFKTHTTRKVYVVRRQFALEQNIGPTDIDKIGFLGGKNEAFKYSLLKKASCLVKERALYHVLKAREGPFFDEHWK
jgi:hypothetical protein